MGNYLLKEDIKRDSDGFYANSKMPTWKDEVETGNAIHEWADLIGGKIGFIMMDGNASDDVFSEFDKTGDCSCWEPKYKDDSAVLLSIHDTEDGPTAWYFIPN